MEKEEKEIINKAKILKFKLKSLDLTNKKLLEDV